MNILVNLVASWVGFKKLRSIVGHGTKSSVPLYSVYCLYSVPCDQAP